MVTVPSNKTTVNKSKSDIEDVDSKLETFTLCPSCKGGNAIITDPKSGEIICRRCGMVISDKLLERRLEWRTLAINESEGRGRTGPPASLASHDMGCLPLLERKTWIQAEIKLNRPCFLHCID